MADYNKVILVGNLTRDPEFKTLSSGQALCRLGLASNRQFKNRQTGEMVQEVCFVDIDVWGNQAEVCNQYLQKGRAVLIDGRLKLDTWQDNNGNNRSKHTIVAERVVFLSQQAYDEKTSFGTATAGSGQKDPSSDLEKELLNQIDQIKEKASRNDSSADVAIEAAKEDKPKKAAKKVAAKSEDVNKVGDVTFKDEPPFEDDLPF
ncbi:single-stranded DNA-binding protein [Candidatus Dependentiae bacterium]